LKNSDPPSLSLKSSSKKVAYLHSVLLGPLLGGSFISASVILVDVGDFGDQRIVGVGVSQQRTDGQQHLSDGQSGGPLILQDIQADTTVGVDVRMVNSSIETDLGRLEGIISGEVNAQEENTSGIGTVFGTHNGSLPVEVITVIGRSGTAMSGRITTEVNQFLRAEGDKDDVRAGSETE